MDGIGMTIDRRGDRRGRRRVAGALTASSLLIASLVALVAVAVLSGPWSAAAAADVGRTVRPELSAGAGPDKVRAASIDPAEYLPKNPNAAVLARDIAERLAQAGVNTIYINAYNVKYGAYYLTSYRYNSES